MKTHSTILLVLILLKLNFQASVQQEIRYKCNDAREVFIVWGINNWQPIPEKDLPQGSWIKDKLIYTPMRANDEHVFTVNLDIPKGSLIDYVFWITKGPLDKGVDLWDTNLPPEKDYHTYASANSITLVESEMKIVPPEQPGIMDFSGILLLITAAVSFVVFLMLRKRKVTLRSNVPAVILSSGGTLLLLLLIVRITVAGLAWKFVSDPFGTLPQIFWSGFYDVLYVLFITVLFLLSVLLLKKYPRVNRIIGGVYVTVALCSLILAIANVKVVEMLGKPFNYQWLYYSDFLQSPDSKAAIFSSMPTGFVANISKLLAAAVLLTFLSMLLIHILNNSRVKRPVFIATCILTVLYLFVAPSRIKAYRLEYDRLANPVYAFVSSANPFASHPTLFTMAVPDSLLLANKAKPYSMEKLGIKGIKNVLIVVLESTPAEYVDVYGSKFKATPNIKNLSEHAMVFKNVYAHAPATNLSMVSLLGSIYPWLSYNSFTEEHPEMSIPTLSSELSSKGYRTSFFNSGDNNYQKAGEFLSHRAFDSISDCNAGMCRNNKFEVENKDWKNMGGKDDGCSAGELLSWIDADSIKPFFAVMWTYQTHYPYFFEGNEKSYVSKNPYFNRYLNALNYADNIIGKIEKHLKQTKRMESTLLVLIGDHGEAFGRHEQVTHGRKIYEENLHIPCLLINPAFSKTTFSVPGGMVDVAPTILNFLGYNAPDSWEGESLLSKHENSRVYFFAPWSDYLFGYREKNYKFIYNATKNEAELYDLEADPLETNNIIEKDKVTDHRYQVLAAWTQRVNRTTAKITEQENQETIAKPRDKSQEIKN